MLYLVPIRSPYTRTDMFAIAMEVSLHSMRMSAFIFITYLWTADACRNGSNWPLALV